MAVSAVVSGGQTGVDRAALDVARALSLQHGGWCPKGRKAEDGTIPPGYLLKETPRSDYTQRTEWNVRDSDGTLLLTRGALSGGTAQTVESATRLRKPWLLLDLEQAPDIAAARRWLRANRIRVLNVAGPRESKSPGIYAQTGTFLRTLLSA